VCQQGTRLTNNILKLKIKTKKSSLETVRQIIRQKPAKASGVRQPKKVDRKMTGMSWEAVWCRSWVEPVFTRFSHFGVLGRSVLDWTTSFVGRRNPFVRLGRCHGVLPTSEFYIKDGRMMSRMVTVVLIWHFLNPIRFYVLVHIHDESALETVYI
jgi:hypothetical protein